MKALDLAEKLLRYPDADVHVAIVPLGPEGWTGYYEMEPNGHLPVEDAYKKSDDSDSNTVYLLMQEEPEAP